MKVAFLVQLPKKVSPGQRFRIEQYESALKSKNIQSDTYPFIDSTTYKVIYKPGHLFQKTVGVIKGFCRRVLFLFKASKYNYIFLQREASPIGPPVFEWILAKILNKKLILDFDDAIWIKDASGNNKVANAIKCFWKVKYLCRWSYKVSVGNYYLLEYASRYNKNVILIPTCVDTVNRYNRVKSQDTKRVAIGWTGSHSTLKYLDPIFPILKEMERKLEFDFIVICDRRPDLELKSIKFVNWNEPTEIEDLLKINIGIMPLVNDAWTNGKCGFKLIQYLSLGIPAVASAVGVNDKIVCHGKSGFLCSTDEQWRKALTNLLSDKELRVKMGREGRLKMEAQYSLQANEGLFLSLFE